MQPTTNPSFSNGGADFNPALARQWNPTSGTEDFLLNSVTVMLTPACVDPYIPEIGASDSARDLTTQNASQIEPKPEGDDDLGDISCDGASVEAPDGYDRPPEVDDNLDTDLVVASPCALPDEDLIERAMHQIGRYTTQEKHCWFYQGMYALQINLELAKCGTGTWLKKREEIAVTFGMSVRTVSGRIDFYRGVVAGRIDPRDWGYRLCKGCKDEFALEEMEAGEVTKRRAEADSRATTAKSNIDACAARRSKTSPGPKPATVKLRLIGLSKQQSKVITHEFAHLLKVRNPESVCADLAAFIHREYERHLPSSVSETAATPEPTSVSEDAAVAGASEVPVA